MSEFTHILERVEHGDAKAAAELLPIVYEELQQRQASQPPYLNAPRRVAESLERLVQLYVAWGKTVEAAEWKQKMVEFEQAAKAAEKKAPQP